MGFLIFNTRNGRQAQLGCKQRMIEMLQEGTGGSMDARTAAAFGKMELGEYVWYYHFLIARVTSGVTTDELKAR